MKDIQIIPVNLQYDVGPVNLYLLKDATPVLIDPGPAWDAADRALEQRLLRWGWSQEDIEHVFLTHGHVDHAGNAGVMEKAFRPAIYGHPEDHLLFVTTFEQRAHMLFPQYRYFHQRWGAPVPTHEERMKTARMFSEFFKPVLHYEGIHDGQEFSFDNFRLRVIHAPGHSMGSVAFYEPDRRILFSGDMLLEHTRPCAFFRIDTTGASSNTVMRFLESMERFEALEIDWVYPGHGEPFQNWREVIGGYRRHFESRRNQIMDVLHGRKDGMTAHQVRKAVYPNLRGFAVWAGMSMVVGHMECLVAWEQLKVDASGEADLYHVA